MELDGIYIFVSSIKLSLREVLLSKKQTGFVHGKIIVTWRPPTTEFEDSDGVDMIFWKIILPPSFSISFFEIVIPNPMPFWLTFSTMSRLPNH
jgi:hypothetical protein